MATTALDMSSNSTRAPTFLPEVRITLVMPVMPLPKLRTSTPLATRAAMSPNGTEPIR